MESIGFIGLGVMGEPICRHLKTRTQAAVRAYDRDGAPGMRLAAHGVRAVADVGEACAGAQAVFLSLPSGEVVEALACQPGGLLESLAPGAVLVDLGTTSVATTRALAAAFAARGVDYADAPVARTRAAAEAGALSVMVGADADVFERIRPLLGTFATDITRCGAVGCGQVVKILNNMVLFETVVALAEARHIAERAGVDPTLLFETLAKGFADSFALRNHGMKAIVPAQFPERAFPVAYARKDLEYAIRLATETGVDARATAVVRDWFDAALESGRGDRYFPVVSELIGARGVTNGDQ